MESRLAIQIVAALSACFVATSVVAETSRETLRRSEVDRQQGLWRSVAQAEPKDKIGSRQLMGYALALSEARQSPERLPRLLSLLAQMQDRDHASATYGNLKWRWGDAGVSDPNAVEFCMHDAVLLWKRHSDWMPPEARDQLWTLMRFGAEAVRRHSVDVSYTNIALSRAGNLILLGEILGNREMAEEGTQRLNEVVTWTAANGIHECVSPTYYAVDINALMLIVTCSQNVQAKRQANLLLQLLWTDMALNWFPAAERLSGATSRTYDCLSGRGALDWYLWTQRWFEDSRLSKAERVEPYWDEWTPPADLRTISRERLPRLVRQCWDQRPAHARTYMAYRDVGLSTLSTGYGVNDIPLAIDLPAPRDMPRGYFRADGRDNPYGDQKFATGPGRQRKPNHLTPYWLAAQREQDALAVVIYDPRKNETDSPEAHLVLPRNATSIAIAERMVEFDAAGKDMTLPVRSGEPVVLRYGTAAVGVRFVGAVASNGAAAPIALVDDRNPHGCIRLTADLAPLQTTGERASTIAWPAIVLWVRVGSNLTNEAEFSAWRQRFSQASPTRLAVDAKGVDVEVPGVSGPLAVTVVLDKRGRPSAKNIVPEPTRCVLELDSKEVGRSILMGR